MRECKERVHLNIEERSVAKRLLRRGRSPELVAAAFGTSFWTIAKLAREVERQRKAGEAYLAGQL